MEENKQKNDNFINEKKILEVLSNNKDFEKIKQELDKGNNFIDYFLVIGLEPEIYKKEWLYNEELDVINTKYKDEIKPKIISSFPPFEKTTISFDDSILSHCFPHGYQLTKSLNKPKPKVFSFILDNNFFNINYPQKYLSCLICYECVSQYKILYELDKKYNETQKDEKKGDENKKDGEEDFIYIPKCLLIMSLYPFFGEFEKIITEIYNYSLNQVIQLIDNSENSSKSSKKKFMKRLSLKEVSLKAKDVNEPIEKIIENLLIELPVPPQGISTVKYFLNEEERTIKQNKMNNLPLVDVNLKRICLDFEPKDIIMIYNYLFLETRILFFSKNIEYLNTYIYGLLALLYPFQYQYQIITILPEENFEILESITPFIAGINQPFEDDFFEKNNFVLSDCFFVVDIDKKVFKLFGEETKIPEFPKNARKGLEKKLQDLFNKSLKDERRLKTNFTKQKSLRNSSIMVGRAMTTQSISLNPNDSSDSKYISSITLQTKDSSMNQTSFSEEGGLEIEIEEDEEITELLSNLNIDFDFNQEVNESFFNFNATLLANYNNCLNRDFYSSNTAPSLDVLFRVSDYLKKVPATDKNFYEKFITETQIFGDFLYLRMIPKNTKEKIRILLFDEKINQNSKSITNIFTQTKEYKFVDNHIIQRPRKLTKKEIDFYKDINNEKKLINYGVIATEDKNDPNKIIFQYPIFPKLTNLLFLPDNIGVYFPPENWSENINLINEDLISKSHLGDVSIRLDDMKKYIYLCWMQMWALTFWYCEENEKRYWFQELVRIIEVSSCYEMEIFNLLFEALNKYGKENMVLKLYDILLKKKLNPSFKVHNIVMKIMENKNVSGKMNDKINKIIGKDTGGYKKVNFSKRTFRSKYYPNILTENIKFYGFDTCIFCQKDINLEILSKNLKNMNRDLTWTNCPSCKSPILPKLTVQFGEEINRNGDMKTNTCIFETVVLFSPYILKNNYNTSFSRNVGVKLDVHDLMMKYSSIFWNSLWYFKINGLEYDFMQPYYYRLQPIKPYKELKVTLVENGKNDSDDEDNKEPFEISQFKINNNSFTIK